MSYRRTQSLGRTSALMDALLAALSTVPGAALLVTPKIHLIKNPSANVGPNYDVADLATDECDFTGYSATAVGTLLGPVNAPNQGRALHKETDFLATAVPTPQYAYSYIVTDTTSAILYCWEVFTDPVYFALPGDFLSLDVIFSEPQYTAGQ